MMRERGVSLLMASTGVALFLAVAPSPAAALSAQAGGATSTAAAPQASAPDARAPGIPGPQAVDPAPGAAGPYAGHSEHAFYDVDGRLAAVEARAREALRGDARRRALKAITQIRAEERDQIARHGDLLDWARENINHRIDSLIQSYPALAG